MLGVRFGSTFIILTLLSAVLPVWAVSGADIRALGLSARLDPAHRDARLQEIAGIMEQLPRERVLALQGDFQYALMLHVDEGIYDSLSPETIEAIDNALERCFTLDDIARDNTWEPLIYTYGFFNRDVSAGTIQEVLYEWSELPEEEKAPRYPTAIHVIDAVCKPVSMGPIGDEATTGSILSIVVPAMKAQFLDEPKPGTAFHPPSHACLVLVPLYLRWAEHPVHGALIREHLGSRAEFEELLVSRLIGGLPDGVPESHMLYGYYGYIGAYLANALARLDARAAVPALRRSLQVYEERGKQGRASAYTRRALIALGDEASRAVLESQLKENPKADTVIDTAVWLARNGRGEARSYGEALLGKALGVDPEAALSAILEQSLRRVQTKR